MKKYLFIAIALLFSSMSVVAQTAREVLEKTSQTVLSSKAMCVTFTGTNFNGTQEVGNFKGTITLRGSSYSLDSDMIRAWFDGKTLWTIFNGSEEVNVSNPTQEELQSMNPMYFLNLYKKGYTLTCETLKHNGIPAYQVNMLESDPAMSIDEMRVIISQSTLLPLSIRMRKGKDWFRIRISNCETNVKVTDATFRFDASKYPGYEVIDLR
jgi:outer membrane lipoprotein-sorting protein